MRTEPAAQSEYMYTYMYMHVCVNYVRACTYIPRAECRHTTASAACRQWAAGRSRAARAWRRVAARCSSATDTWTCPRLAPRWSCASARHVTHTANDLNVRYHVTMLGRCTMWRGYLVLPTQFTYQPFVNQEANRQNSERRHNHEYPVNEMLVDVQCLVALFKVVHILKRHKMHSFRIRKNATPSVRAHIQLSLFYTQARQLRHSSKNLRNNRDPFILPQ